MSLLKKIKKNKPFHGVFFSIVHYLLWNVYIHRELPVGIRFECWPRTILSPIYLYLCSPPLFRTFIGYPI